MPAFSIIIPVYNRPDEIKELLESLTKQNYNDFEIIVVEDGSSNKCEEVVNSFNKELNINYFYKENSGPGDSRNFGVRKANTGYYIFFDSDCLIPENYFSIISSSLEESKAECFGGPDKSHPSFTPIQKAISYTMTSFLTTGGIRGGSKKVTKFYPRSFNMGFSKKVFEATQGYAPIRFGEDLDLSMRIEKLGFNPVLIPDAFVYHKRRTDFRKFFKQIFNSGIARINLHKRHPGSLKITHAFPALFLTFMILSVLLSFVCVVFIIPLISYLALILVDSAIQNKNIRIGCLSVIAALVQMSAYGLGFIKAFFKQIILQQSEFTAYEQTFYK